MSSVVLFSSGFSHRSLYVFHVSLVRAARPTQLSFLDLSTVVLGKGTNFTKFSSSVTSALSQDLTFSAFQRDSFIVERLLFMHSISGGIRGLIS
jgi:hypothetical protein